MPELDMIVMARCVSNLAWEREVQGSTGEYTVRFQRVDEERVGVLYDFTCTCPAFKHRPGYCKHIKEVQPERCGWMQLMHGGEAVRIPHDPYWKCPRCGDGVDFYREGV